MNEELADAIKRGKEEYQIKYDKQFKQFKRAFIDNGKIYNYVKEEMENNNDYFLIDSLSAPVKTPNHVIKDVINSIEGFVASEDRGYIKVTWDM